MSTPAQLGYRWPAEWEPHRATWLSWPHNLETWPDALPAVRATFANFVRALAPHEAVEIGVADDAMEDVARAAIRAAGADPDRNVRFHRYPTTDAWCRDHGPIFVVKRTDGSRALCRFPLRQLGRASIPAGSSTTPYRVTSRRSSACRASRATWCSKAAASTATGTAPCSPPSRAC